MTGTTHTGDEEFETRFDNWVRWCRAKSKFLPPLTCQSLEHHYRPPEATAADVTGWGDWADSAQGAVRMTRPKVDARDAVLVNRAFLALLAHGVYRKALKLYYFRQHLRAGWMARKLGINAHALDATVRTGKVMMRNALSRIEANDRTAAARTATMAQACAA